VDTYEKTQIRLLLEHLTSESRRSNSIKQGEMRDEHTAKGQVCSVATVSRTVSISEVEARDFIKNACEQVGEVSKTIEAFDMIFSSLLEIYENWEYHVDEAKIFMASDGGKRSEALEGMADILLIDLKRRLFRELQIHRFAFARASRIALHNHPAPVSSLPAQPKNKGGKPLAAHWDGMWAEIATQIYLGDLKPTSQKQIKDAMFAWFNAKGIDAGDTAVTERARQLWQKIEASQ